MKEIQCVWAPADTVREFNLTAILLKEKGYVCFISFSVGSCDGLIAAKEDLRSLDIDTEYLEEVNYEVEDEDLCLDNAASEGGRFELPNDIVLVFEEPFEDGDELEEE